MFVIIFTSGYDSPEAQGPFESAKQARAYLIAALLNSDIAEDADEANRMAEEDYAIVPLSAPYADILAPVTEITNRL